MCLCEQEFACRYLPHQINHGTELETQQRIKVTVGFQPDICDACRGIPNTAYPVAKIYGRTSKLVRYYWREISFETIPKFAEWAETQGFSDWAMALVTYQEKYKSIEKQVKEKIKIEHECLPKYIYQKESQSAIIQKYNVEIVNINATYVKNGCKGAQIIEDNTVLSPEEFVIKYFELLGYQAIVTESIPFHVLFGVFTYLLIQDFDDPKLQLVGFGDRFEFEKRS